MSGRRSTSSNGTSAAAMFAGNLLLALGWVALSGHFDVANLLVGFFFGYIVLYLLQRVIGRSRYFTRTTGLVRFAAFYLVEVVRANVRVAFDVITPTSYARPGVVAVPLDARTDAEVAGSNPVGHPKQGIGVRVKGRGGKIERGDR